MKKSEDIIFQALEINPGDKFIITCLAESESDFLFSDLKRQRTDFLRREISDIEEIFIEKIQQNGKYGVVLSKRSPDSTKACIMKSSGEIEKYDLMDEKDNHKIPDFDKF